MSKEPCTINMKPGWFCARSKHEDGPCALVEMPDFNEIGKQRETAATIGDPNLFCYGCAHSAGGEPFPSFPSGERPCCFCVRNPKREEWARDRAEHGEPKIDKWYDSSPIAFYPMDAYCPIDLKEQIDRWRRKAEGDSNWNEPQGGLRFG